MSLLVVGSIAFDSIETPHGSAQRVLGGSASYLSYAAAFFTDTRLMGPVGEDFPQETIDVFANHGVDTAGIEKMPGKTFFWHGKYHGNMDRRDTLQVDQNVLGEYNPTVPEKYRDSEYIFLANAQPSLQIHVLDQMPHAKLVFCDTMKLWIETQCAGLTELLKKVDGVVLNEEEARLLTDTACPTLVAAGRRIQKMGPDHVVIKKGEHGALLLTGEHVFAIPAYPLEHVFDPTGAGDTFGGGMMGHLVRTGDLSFDNMKRALLYGSITASFNVEDFSLERLKKISIDDIESRCCEFVEMMRLD